MKWVSYCFATDLPSLETELLDNSAECVNVALYFFSPVSSGQNVHMASLATVKILT